jgi:sulfide dehydrogenase cytochrome subunit
MKSKHSAAMSLALGILLTGTAMGDVSAIVENCEGCHGDNGVSQWSDVPTIAGIPEFVHADALYLFRDQARPCLSSEYRQGDTSRTAQSMCDVTAELDDATLDAVAAYYFEQPFVAAKQEFDADLAAAGKAIHEQQCERCHSDGGANPDDEASILAGQWAGYLENAFAQYQEGDREQPKSMADRVNALSADDIKALVNFYASQQ